MLVEECFEKRDETAHRCISAGGGMAVKAFEKKQAILVTEFDRYVVEHPDFASQIPPGAQVVIQVEGDDAFNEWARRLADGQQNRINSGFPYARISLPGS